MEKNSQGYSVYSVLYCVIGLFAFAVQDSIVKRLSSTYPVMELLTIRVLVVLVTLTVIAVCWKGRTLLLASRPGILLLRGVCAFVAFTAYYLALAVMPLADGAAIYMTAPLWVTALSVPFLGEHVGWHRWAAVTIGFAAAVFMINPGAGVFQPAAVLPLFSAVIYAFIPIINRKIGLSEHALTMALYNIIGYAILCVGAGILIHSVDFSGATGVLSNLGRRWIAPNPQDLAWIALSGEIFIVGLLCLTQAYRLLPVSIVAPFEYSYILWATLLGYLVFSEVPGPRTIIGGLIVVLCGCYIAIRERRQKA